MTVLPEAIAPRCAKRPLRPAYGSGFPRSYRFIAANASSAAFSVRSTSASVWAIEM